MGCGNGDTERGVSESESWSVDSVEDTERPLRAVIRIEPDDYCPLLQFDVSPDHIQAQLAGDTCLCKAIVTRSETVVEQTERPLEDDCACSVFHENACVVDITEVDGTGITITTHVPDRSVLGELIEELQAVGDSVSLQELVSTSRSDLANRIERVDLASLTEKQRSAVELAIEEGYYNRPRKTSLQEMAEELNISQQALSQRLGSVEEKLITQLFKKC